MQRSATTFDLKVRTIDSPPVTERPASNRGVPVHMRINSLDLLDLHILNKQSMTLKKILADPSISSWLKDAIKTAYEQDPLDALRDARRLLNMLGERYTQVVNRSLAQ
jgi:hypothetical protein